MDKLRIKKINLVATWNLFKDIEECVICKESIEKYYDLENNSKKSIIISSCNHIFHINCIEKWHEKNKNCPICKRNWDQKNIKFM